MGVWVQMDSQAVMWNLAWSKNKTTTLDENECSHNNPNNESPASSFFFSNS